MESKSLPAPIPPEIQELSKSIEQWRSTRVQRGPMPEPLWTLAASLAKQHGLARISRCLHLDYYSLKEHLDATNRAAASRSEPQPTFIELPVSNGASVAECTIELEHPRGPRLRIHVKGAAMTDLAVLSRSLWGMK